MKYENGFRHPTYTVTRSSYKNLSVSDACNQSSSVLAGNNRYSKMKFAVIFLFALMVISHQQLQGPRGVIWVSPYYSPPQPLLQNYQSPYYKDPAYFDNIGGDEYYQSRIGGAFDAQQQQQNNARFFFQSNRNAVTVTVTLTTATVQSCIPAAQLVAGAGACRRKRRPILELDDSPTASDEDAQFPIIDPSETLKVSPSALPLPGMNREAFQHQLTEKESIQDAGLLLSSKDEVLSSDASTADQHVTNFREKRLFFNLGNNFAMMANPSTSFVIVPTLILKTVSLGGLASVLCLPAGYVQC